MTRRVRVGVIFGGRSGEHEVSLVSARTIMDALDPTRYEVVPIGIAKDGTWLLTGDPHRELTRAAEAEHRALESAASLPRPTSPPEGEGDLTPYPYAAAERGSEPSLRLLSPSRRAGTSGARVGGEVLPDTRHPTPDSRSLVPADMPPLDVVFPVLHGPYGEDGTVQGLFELAGIPYVGAGVAASAVGMDKAMMKALFRDAGLPTVPLVVVHRRELEDDDSAIIDRIERDLGYPCFTKPANLGSSVGISKCRDRDQLRDGLREAARYDRKILVEKGLSVRELECSVLGNDDPIASVVGEIIPAAEFYDYDAKYRSDQTRLIIPAEIPPDVADEIRRLAVIAFRSIDAAGLARVDFFLEIPAERVYVNEINTMPGFTSVSMYPKLWAASGLSYPELLQRLIDLAIERHIERRTTLRRATDESA
ncbi:MAG TPA: D-alanine--D-alanine ligase family protein [Dehalococcoidia bacterium]|nr:D-alanine--D-alanine ligase family protein [Dehalococcoidia bacterium]